MSEGAQPERGRETGRASIYYCGRDTVILVGAAAEVASSCAQPGDERFSSRELNVSHIVKSPAADRKIGRVPLPSSGSARKLLQQMQQEAWRSARVYGFELLNELNQSRANRWAFADIPSSVEQGSTGAD